MDELSLMRQRHSVRQYTAEPIPYNVQQEIAAFVATANRESGLNMQLFFDEPFCFGKSKLAYGQFKNANNYLVLIGKKTANLDETVGYYGQKVMMKLQALGLGSCWVGLTHGKTMAKIGPNEKLVIVVSFGYPADFGFPHKNKPLEKLVSIQGNQPDWLKRGIEGALLAPTAINQQKFKINYDGNRVRIKKGLGPYSAVDLGIVKYCFEAASGHKIHS